MKKKFGNSVATIEIEVTKKAAAPSLLEQAADATIQKPPFDEKPKEEAVKLSDLPLLSMLPRKHMETVRDAFEEIELHLYTEDDNGKRVTRKDRIDELKKRIETIQDYARVKGFRHGEFAFRSKYLEGRMSLDKGKLMENGVTAQQIADSMKKGEGYVENRFQRIADKD